MLFDLPSHPGTYSQRYQALTKLVSELDINHIAYVRHFPVEDKETLFHRLDNISKRHGEGIMLRRIRSRYQAGRSQDLLKLKRHDDDEATVIGYKPGKGKYNGSTGSLLVRNQDGAEFYVGSGLTDELRHNPPPIGTVITYRYNVSWR